MNNSLRPRVAVEKFSVAGQKIFDDLGRIASFDIGFIIHLSHFLICHFARQPVKQFAHFRMAIERFRSDHRYGVVWRKVASVVFERDKIEF
jgi:hypothetical protein